VAFRRDRAVAAAERFAAKGQHDRAAREYQSIVDADPSDIRSWLLLADCLVRSGQKNAAIDRYLHVGEFYTQGRQPQKALAVYRQVLNLDPERLDVHLRCAGLFRELGQMPDAVLVYEKAGAALLKAGQTDEAFECYAAVCDIEPANVAKRLRLAELYSREQRVDEAVEQFGRCARQLLDDNRLQEYVRVAERLLYHQQIDDVLRDLAGVYLRLSEPRRALMKLNTLLQKSPSDPSGLELLAETFAGLGKHDKAVSVMLELARGERGRGPESQSSVIRVLRRALEWDPSNPQVRSALEEASREAPVPPRVERSAEASEGSPEDLGEIEELDAEEVEELEADELEEIVEEQQEEGAEEEAATGELHIEADEAGVPEPIARSLTQEVVSEAAHAEAIDLEPESDVDKVLHEVRVLAKYRLYEHALAYLDGAFATDPHHVGALELKAELLIELDRNGEAAAVFVQLARRVAPTDPELAQRHLKSALEAEPGHAGARATAAELTLLASDPDASGPIQVAVPESLEPDVDTGLLADAVGSTGAHEPEGLLLDGEEGEEAGIPASMVVDESGIILDEGDFDGTDAEEFETSQIGGAGQVGVIEESVEFAISVDTAAEQPAETEPRAVEDRFGLEGDDELADEAPTTEQPVVGAEPASSEPEQDWPDLTDEIEEIEFFLGRDLHDDAAFAFEDLRGRHPDHPAVRALAARLGGGDEVPPPAVEAALAPVVSPTPSGAETPLLDLDEDDEADGYLAAIFSEGPRQDKVVEHRAVARVEDADAGTHFDLGTAYREMGLVDDALAEFKAAARDPRWQAKALVMTASLHLHRGDTAEAIRSLESAIAAARTDDERSEAHYELGSIHETLGDAAAAIRHFEQVHDGFRDKAERLEALRG
jgi:tetratricopeptide (TPR) repeat protein